MLPKDVEFIQYDHLSNTLTLIKKWTTKTYSAFLSNVTTSTIG
jgi:hypothetical protein